MASHIANESLPPKDNDFTIECKPSAQHHHHHHHQQQLKDKEPPRRKFIPLPPYEIDWAKEFARGHVFHSDQCQSCNVHSWGNPRSEEYASRLLRRFIPGSSHAEPQVEKPTCRQLPKPPTLVKFDN